MSLSLLGGEVHTISVACWMTLPSQRQPPGAATRGSGSAAPGAGFYGLAAGALRPGAPVGSRREGRSEAPPHAAHRRTERRGGGEWWRGMGGWTAGAADQGQGAREAEDASKRSPAGQTTSSALSPWNRRTISQNRCAREEWRVVTPPPHTHTGPLRLAALLGMPPAPGSLFAKGPESAGVARWARWRPQREPSSPW